MSLAAVELGPLLPEVHWARPLVLLALLALPLHWFLRRRQDRRDVVPYAPLQFGTPGGHRRSWSTASRVLELAVVALLLTALAGPYRSTTTELVEDAGTDVALVLDISLSMLAEDFQPTRLAALRRIAGRFLARRSADRFALVIFAKDTYVQSPLTTDDAVLNELLQGVTVYALDQYRSGGTAIGDALLVAADQLSQARIEGRGQSIILITDGESNLGIDPTLAVRYLREHEINFYAIGVGGPESVEVLVEGRRVGEDGLWTELDEESLLGLAEIAEGRYFRADDTDALEDIFGELSRLESSPLSIETIERRHPLAPRLALLALLAFGGYVASSAVILRRPLR